MSFRGKPTVSALLLLGMASHATAADVMIKTRLVPDANIRSGQPVIYEVDVLTDTWLTGTPEFHPLQIAGALVSFEGSQGRSIQRNIGGKRYFGVTYSYRLIPLEPGVTTLPPFRIQAPVGQEDQPINAIVPERSFAVQPLPAADAADISLLAGNVRLSQTLSPGGGSISAGQPIIREIRVEAQQALALSIPPLTPASADDLPGTRLPADIRPITDQRGWAIGGERFERIRYIPDREGVHTLPALSLTWWDIDDERLRQSTLPALEIVVTPVAGASPPRLPRGWPLMFLAIGAPIVLAARYRRAISAHLGLVVNRIRNRWQNSGQGKKRAAIQQLKGSPPDLTGIYRLVECKDNAYSLRDSRLELQLQDALLEGIAGYYAARPEPLSSTRKLIKTIRTIRPKPSKSRQPPPLPPLNSNHT